MVFFLRKFIEALMLPVGISGALVVAGIVVRRRWITIAGVVALYLFSAPIVGDFFLRPLESVYAPMTVAAAPQADAIVVLSGDNVRGVTAPGLQWGESSNRYFGGLDLALAGKARLLILTPGGTQDSEGPNQAVLLRRNAIERGIPEDRIVIISPVLTTGDEARGVSQIPAVHSILLVTSALHMPRATLLFRHHGLNVTPFPTDERVWGKSYLNSMSFIPRAVGMQASEGAMREYYGLATYRLIFLFHGAGK